MEQENISIDETPVHDFDLSEYPGWAQEEYENGEVTYEELKKMKNFPTRSCYQVEIDLQTLEKDVASKSSKSDVTQDLELLMLDIAEAKDRHENFSVPNMDVRLEQIRSYLAAVH